MADGHLLGRGEHPIGTHSYTWHDATAAENQLTYSSDERVGSPNRRTVQRTAAHSSTSAPRLHEQSTTEIWTAVQLAVRAAMKSARSSTSVPTAAHIPHGV